jgi:hypothetical protein
MASPRFEVIEEPDQAPEQPPKEFGLLVLALKALSQRAMVALANSFTFLTMLGAWYLWYLTPDPSPTQIVSLTIFALFVLAANWLVRRR